MNKLPSTLGGHASLIEENLGTSASGRIWSRDATGMAPTLPLERDARPAGPGQRPMDCRYGSHGSRRRERARGFRMTVVYTDTFGLPAYTEDDAGFYSSMRGIKPHSDALRLHLPGRPNETQEGQRRDLCAAAQARRLRQRRARPAGQRGLLEALSSRRILQSSARSRITICARGASESVHDTLHPHPGA